MLTILMLSKGVSNTTFYWLLLIVGLPNGYWSVFMASASEQFGTNIRATVTTSAPNFVRGMVVVLSTLFSFLNTKGGLGFVGAASLIGSAVMALAIFSTIRTQDTFHKDLDYIEG
jgi:hypothetical protein